MNRTHPPAALADAGGAACGAGPSWTTLGGDALRGEKRSAAMPCSGRGCRAATQARADLSRRGGRPQVAGSNDHEAIRCGPVQGRRRSTRVGRIPSATSMPLDRISGCGSWPARWIEPETEIDTRCTPG